MPNLWLYFAPAALAPQALLRPYVVQRKHAAPAAKTTPWSATPDALLCKRMWSRRDHNKTHPTKGDLHV